jgi:hypothetical protein
VKEQRERNKEGRGPCGPKGFHERLTQPIGHRFDLVGDVVGFSRLPESSMGISIGIDAGDPTIQFIPIVHHLANGTGDIGGQSAARPSAAFFGEPIREESGHLF